MGVGASAAWQLSPILAPLAPVKQQVTVLSNVGNYGPFGGHIEPSNSNNTAAFLTCTKATLSSPPPQVVTCGTSVDQVIAKAIGSATRIPSLQLGLSTLDSYLDGLPASCSRSISWASPTEPLFKIVNPQTVFDRLFSGAVGPTSPGTPAAGGWAADKSVLDYVLASATSVQKRLSASDRARLDQFMTSVREVEKNIQDANLKHPGCLIPPRPKDAYEVMHVPADYNRNVHADIMIDLLVLALACDFTRVVTFMMDDARSDFVYNFLTERLFTQTGSTLGSAPVGGYDGLTHAGNTNNGWATVNYWFVEKLSRLCQKMAAIPDGPGGSLLDQSVVWFGSEMHGGNNDGLDLPVLYVSGSGGRLKVDQHLDFGAWPAGSKHLANVYLTFIQKVFDLPETSFGTFLPSWSPDGGGALLGSTADIVPEILAAP
jgi:hypothetical protein